ARARRRSFRELPARRTASLWRGVRFVRPLGLAPAVRARVVSASRDRLAAVFARPVAQLSALRMDMGRVRPVGLADAPLRAVGLLSGSVVLDSRALVGPGLGLLGALA